jgi:hypothetical protein
MKSAVLCAVIVLAAIAGVPGTPLAQEQDSRDIPLVRQESSDCSNADVVEDPTDRSGRLLVYRRPDPRTHVRVNLAMQPNTTYHFYLKCVQFLGDITTQADGFAVADFVFDNSLAGNVFAFELYVEGAEPGERYQSAKVDFTVLAPIAAMPRAEYLLQTAGSISFNYRDMPANIEIALIDAATGVDTGTTPLALPFGGLGTVDFAIAPGLAGGAYYLLARGQADKQYIAQTVTFYIN